MTIEIIDSHHVILTKGRWFWKRQARVHKEGQEWYYSRSGKKVSSGTWLFIHHSYNPPRRTNLSSWEKIPKKAKLPEAKLLTK